MPLVLLRFTTRVVTCFSTPPPLHLSTSFVDEAFWKMGNLESKGEGEIGRGREGKGKPERKKERKKKATPLSLSRSLPSNYYTYRYVLLL